MTTMDLDELAGLDLGETAAVDAEGNEVATAKVDGRAANGAKIAAARREKLDKIFGGGKHYTVVKEFDFKGRTFETGPNAGEQIKLETPLGNKIMKGFSIKLDEGFEPEAPYEAKMVFGLSVLLEAQRTYGAIELPEAVVKASKPRVSAEDKAAAEADKVAARRALMDALASDLGF